MLSCYIKASHLNRKIIMGFSLWSGKGSIGGFQFGDLKPSYLLLATVDTRSFMGAKYGQLSFCILLSLSYYDCLAPSLGPHPTFIY